MQEYNEEEINKQIAEEMKQYEESLKKPNILICGQTGAGKTSVIKYLFEDKAADAMVGKQGLPCTKDIEFYKGDNINIYDSEGYEIGQTKQAHYRQLLIDGFLRDKEKQGKETVHAVWYSINGAGKKVTDLDLSLIKEIQSLGYPIAVLITKIDELDEQQLNEIITPLQESGAPYFRTSIRTDLAGVNEFCDWEKLNKWTANAILTETKDNYIAASKDLETKRKQAELFIYTAVGAAGTVALSPIPFSDAALLTPIQIGLIYKVLRIYNISKGGKLINLFPSVVISNFGKTLAANLTKLLPGIGSVAGAAANTITAAGITYALGKAIQQICHVLAEKNQKGEEVAFDISKILNDTEFQELWRQIYNNSKGIVLDLIKQK